MIWSASGKLGTLGLSFISNLVLARILMPSDFGYIGMLYIFLSISQAFINGGLGSALIQKKAPTHLDYTSVFYWNLVISIFFVIVLFFSAQSIANFYRMPLLKNILQILSISLIINSFSLVQSVQLQKELRFKELSIRSIITTFIGMIISIPLALKGYGVWSLIFSSLASSLVNVLLLWRISTWRPTFEFSRNALNELFSFGGLILLSTLVETIYTNIQGLIIGKVFSAQSLGYYSQARKLEEVPTIALSSIVNQVSFPVFSKIQDNKSLLLVGVRKNIKAVSFLNFPLMVLLIIIARPLMLILYTQKWEVSILYFQILCFGAMFYTLNTINTVVIKSLGKGNIYFVVQLIKRLIGLVLIIFSVNYGIEAMLWAIASFYYICFIINMFVSKKLINYNIIEQIKDIGLTYTISVAIGILVFYLFSLLNLSNIVALLLQTTTYISLYLLFSYILKLDGFFVYKGTLEDIYKQRKL